MTRKRAEIKSKKKINKSLIIGVLILILLLTAAVVAITTYKPASNNQDNTNNSDGKWLFALDTFTAQVGSIQEYSTGYIPTLVIIDINGDIIHCDPGVHTKEQLMGYVQSGQNPSPSQSLGSAPDFTLQTFDGGIFKLSENKGKVVILDLMAVRCPPCAQQMPELYKLKKELGDTIVILSIDVDAAYGHETEEQVRNAYGEYIRD
jgi:hypothetical protein